MGEKRSYQQRFRLLKNDLNLSNKDIAEITGNDPNSIRTVTQLKATLPRWAKLSIYVHKIMKSKNKFKMEKVIEFLVSSGLLPEDIDQTLLSKKIVIYGEWTLDDDIVITEKRVGAYGDDIFFKGVDFDLEIPDIVKYDDYKKTESKFIENLREMYPNFQISVKID